MADLGAKPRHARDARPRSVLASLVLCHALLQCLSHQSRGVSHDDSSFAHFLMPNKTLNTLNMRRRTGGKEMRDKAKEEPIEQEPYQEGKKD